MSYKSRLDKIEKAFFKKVSTKVKKEGEKMKKPEDKKTVSAVEPKNTPKIKLVLFWGLSGGVWILLNTIRPDNENSINCELAQFNGQKVYEKISLQHIEVEIPEVLAHWNAMTKANFVMDFEPRTEFTLAV